MGLKLFIQNSGGQQYQYLSKTNHKVPIMQPVNFPVNIGNQQHNVAIEGQGPDRYMLIGENTPNYRRFHKLFYGTDPAITETAKLIHSDDFKTALQKPNKGDRNRIVILNKPCSIEAYVLDQEVSRDIDFEELVQTLDELIRLQDNKVKYPQDKHKHPGAFQPHNDTYLTTFVWNLFCRVAHYRNSFSDEEGTSPSHRHKIYFDENDSMQVRTLREYEREYLKPRGLKLANKEEKLHILQVLRRKLELDRPEREQNPRSVLLNFMDHTFFEQRHRSAKIRGRLTLASPFIATATIAFVYFNRAYCQRTTSQVHEYVLHTLLPILRRQIAALSKAYSD